MYRISSDDNPQQIRIIRLHIESNDDMTSQRENIIRDIHVETTSNSTSNSNTE